jgi:hypothetical protein
MSKYRVRLESKDRQRESMCIWKYEVKEVSLRRTELMVLYIKTQKSHLSDKEKGENHKLIHNILL